MTITSLQTEWAGVAGILPRHGKMTCTDVLDTVTTAGFINNSPASAGIPFSNGDFLDVVYNNGSNYTTSNIFRVSIPANSTTITLVGLGS